MTESQRNILIVAALAVLGVVFTQQFGVTAWLLQNLMNVAFCFIVTLMAWQWYTKREGSIKQIDLAWRLLLMVAGAALILTVWTGAIYPGWARGGGMLVVWLLLQGGLIYGIHTIYTNKSSSWY